MCPWTNWWGGSGKRAGPCQGNEFHPPFLFAAPKGGEVSRQRARGIMIAPARGLFRAPAREALSAPHFLFVLPKRKPSRGASLAPSGQFTSRAAAGPKEKDAFFLTNRESPSPFNRPFSGFRPRRGRTVLFPRCPLRCALVRCLVGWVSILHRTMDSKRERGETALLS